MGYFRINKESSDIKTELIGHVSQLDQDSLASKPFQGGSGSGSFVFALDYAILSKSKVRRKSWLEEYIDPIDNFKFE